ncbi:Arm DNA-binding domain-containing protein [Methylobacterium sp. GC_Met_1]|uniref:Arm DNA-binding domain-containing protein n=1 Tax=unclassified Methylobacterium TaxID=2615210 RepID=UPI003211DD91
MAARTNITKRTVEAAEPQGRDYFLWCDEIPGFGLRVFTSGRRSYLVPYRSAGRPRHVTIGLRGALIAKEARRFATSCGRGRDAHEAGRAAMIRPPGQQPAEACAPRG